MYIYIYIYVYTYIPMRSHIQAFNPHGLPNGDIHGSSQHKIGPSPWQSNAATACPSSEVGHVDCKEAVLAGLFPEILPRTLVGTGQVPPKNRSR